MSKFETHSSTAVSPKAIRVETSDGITITVWDHGGPGEPLLLCHCTGTHARVWDPLVPALRDRFRVYAPDTRGHGDSDKPEDPAAYRWSKSGDDLVSVIDALDLPLPVKAAGHSAGAAHICYAAWKRPGALTRVVLIDPIIGPKHRFGGPNPLAERSRRRKNVLPSFDDALERFASKPPLGSWDPAVLEAYVRHGFMQQPDGTIALKCRGEIEAAVYEGAGATDVFEHLHELDLEVLLITADRSDVQDLAELQRERFKNATFERIQGASHFIPQEKPAEIAGKIRDWLE